MEGIASDSYPFPDVVTDKPKGRAIIMKFIVDRKTWYRGKGNIESKLLRNDGMRCCIGFVGKQCGIDDSLLLGHAAAFQAPTTDKWPIWFKVGNLAYPLATAYQINDDPDIRDVTREEKLALLFAENGDEIEFVD